MLVEVSMTLLVWQHEKSENQRFGHNNINILSSVSTPRSVLEQTRTGSLSDMPTITAEARISEDELL